MVMDLEMFDELCLDSKDRVKWWEKSVEYFYYAQYVKGYKSIFPLDGHKEVIGDAIQHNTGKWSIIEFKGTSSSLYSEFNKFPIIKNIKLNAPEGSSDAKQQVMHRLRKVTAFDKLYTDTFESEKLTDEHHFLVYGEIAEKFSLICQRYFTKEPVSDLANLFDKGTDFISFRKYIELFVKLKAPIDGGRSGNGNINLEVLDCEKWHVGFSSDGVLYLLRMSDFSILVRDYDKNNKPTSNLSM